VRNCVWRNERLTKLLDLKRTLPDSIRRQVYCRVIGRSPLIWNRAFLIDKGTEQGIRANMAVMSNISLVGKVGRIGPVRFKGGFNHGSQFQDRRVDPADEAGGRVVRDDDG